MLYVVRVRFLSWNMQHRAESWEWLWRRAPEEGVQVALLQEAAPPVMVPHGVRIHPAEDQHWSIRGAGVGTTRNWCSAVVCFDPELDFEAIVATPLVDARPGEIVSSHPGQWAAARIGGRSVPRAVTFISMYGLWIDVQNYAVPSVHRALSDCTPLFWGARPTVIAGDFNIWRGYGEWRSGYDSVFTRLDSEGFKLLGPYGSPFPDCPCDHPNCNHVATLRRGEHKRWQTDFVFGKSVGDMHCSVVEDSWTVSDHVAVLASPPPTAAEGMMRVRDWRPDS